MACCYIGLCFWEGPDTAGSPETHSLTPSSASFFHLFLERKTIRCPVLFPGGWGSPKPRLQPKSTCVISRCNCYLTSLSEFLDFALLVKTILVLNRKFGYLFGPTHSIGSELPLGFSDCRPVVAPSVQCKLKVAGCQRSKHTKWIVRAEKKEKKEREQKSFQRTA